LEPGEKTKLLSEVNLLESLSREEIEGVGRRIPEMHLERGQTLYYPAYRGRILFLLLRGRVRTYKVVEGREITLGVVRAGEMLGEAALTARRFQGAYAQAMETSEVALMSLDTLYSLVRDKPAVGIKAMKLLSERLSLCEDRLVDIGLKEVPARLAGLLLRLCNSEGIVTSEGYKIPTRYTHEQLATMVGSKRVAATRALGKLREAGAIELRNRYIYVRDIEALERAAGG